MIFNATTLHTARRHYFASANISNDGDNGFEAFDSAFDKAGAVRSRRRLDAQTCATCTPVRTGHLFEPPACTSKLVASSNSPDAATLAAATAACRRRL